MHPPALPRPQRIDWLIAVGSAAAAVLVLVGIAVMTYRRGRRGAFRPRLRVLIAH